MYSLETVFSWNSDFFYFRKLFSISHSIDDMQAYTKISDGIFHQIRLSTDPNLKPAQDLLDKVSRRDLYKCIGRAKPVDNCGLTKVTNNDYITINNNRLTPFLIKVCIIYHLL